jgi:hypothetical protein
MFFLKSDEHLFKIGKELYEDDTFSDVTFVAEGSTFHGHSSLLFSQFPALAEMVCHDCKYGHQEIFIILPSVEQNMMEIALMEFYMKVDPTKLGSILNVMDVQAQQILTEMSESTTHLDTYQGSNKTLINMTENTNYNPVHNDEYDESVISNLDENGFDSDFVTEDGKSYSNPSKTCEEFDFNNCILEICEIIENLSQVDKSKYVKLFEKDDEATVGIQHGKVKALARKKSAKLSPIPQSGKRYPKEVKSGCKTFTKPGSTSSVGRHNTTSGYCLLIDIKDLSMEARGRIVNVLQKDDLGSVEDNLSKESDLEPSQDFQTVYKKLHCPICEYACISLINLEGHIQVKHSKKESQCNFCGKQIDENKLAEHIKKEHLHNKRNKGHRKSSPTNCYLVFVEEKRPTIKEHFPMLTSIQITQKLSEEWQSLSKDEKHMYRLKSAELNKDHKESNSEALCPTCGKIFPDKAEVIQHLVAKHVDLKRQELKHEPS